MLFSEPKIPQSTLPNVEAPTLTRFSALQRAENSSIATVCLKWGYVHEVSVLFSEPKIPQFNSGDTTYPPRIVSVLFSEPKIPQLQSAAVTVAGAGGFSALQRAENSSMRRRRPRGIVLPPFQCSSASRKFLNQEHHSDFGIQPAVSVLFSEPKIPQLREITRRVRKVRRFQCSSASRKFLNGCALWYSYHSDEFQCSSASRKFLNFRWRKLQQSDGLFQCSSASRKFLN